MNRHLTMTNAFGVAAVNGLNVQSKSPWAYIVVDKQQLGKSAGLE
jgi:hypothetical protein